MSPNRSFPPPEVIDLVSSDEENEAPSYATVVSNNKRSRDAASSSTSNAHYRAFKKGNLKSQNDASQQNYHATCMPFINSDVPDNAIVTDAIMPLLHRLTSNNPNIITCSGRNPTTTTTTYSCLLFIQQCDKWSCGFRNLQMLLTALLPLLEESHPYHFAVPSSLGPYPTLQSQRPIPIPSLHQLQSFLQDSWKAGFDVRGAQHYNWRIVSKCAQIGAIEVFTILSYLHLDSCVVQFVKIPKSRALLAPFVYNYFYQGPCACHEDASSVGWAHRLLQLAEQSSLSSFATQSNMNNNCSCPLLPLYLQWEGHSVTIVGVEQQQQQNGQIDFIVFDPLKNGNQAKQALVQTSPTKIPPRMKLSTKFLLKKDVQVVMASPQPLNPEERHAICNGQLRVVTAADEAVAAFVSQSLPAPAASTWAG